MLYYVVKYLGWVGFRVFFRKIYYSNRNKIPKGKPVIFAVNHPTAFMDPVLVGTYIWPTVHFIVRGDIFNSKTVRAILASLKMYPIFRFRDGYSNLKNNQATMDFCYKTLKDGKNILILAEGQTKHEKRLRPIQKGTARMAFGAIDKYGELDIVVLPVGVNYTNSHQFRSEVMMDFGEPIYLKDLMPVYEENPRKAVKQLTDLIAVELKKRVIHIDDEADDKWLNRLLEIQRNDIEKSKIPTLTSSDTLLKREFETVTRVNQMDQLEKEKLKSALEEYQENLEKYEMKDEGIAQPEANSLMKTIYLILGFIPFVFGAIFNSLPLWLGKKVADDKVKKVEFYSSIRYGVMLVSYTIIWFTFLVIAMATGNGVLLVLVLLAPFLGFHALFFQETWEKWKAAGAFKKLAQDARSALIEKRKLLFEHLDRKA